MCMVPSEARIRTELTVELGQGAARLGLRPFHVAQGVENSPYSFLNDSCEGGKMRPLGEQDLYSRGEKKLVAA